MYSIEPIDLHMSVTEPNDRFPVHYVVLQYILMDGKTIYNIICCAVNHELRVVSNYNCVLLSIL